MQHHRMAGLAVLLVCLAPYMAHAQPATAVQPIITDRITTSGGLLEIVPIRHASLMLTWKGAHILIDPAPTGNAAQDAAITATYKTLPPPEFILITHIHGDHFDVPILTAVAGPNTEIFAPRNVRDAMPAGLQAKTKVMKNGERGMLGGAAIETVPMYNITPERAKFHPKGLGNGYVLTFGDRRVYIAGDTEEAPELAHLSAIDAAFIPINLPYTEDVEAAVKWVKDFRPKSVFPYHSNNQDGSKSDMASFESEVGNASIVRLRKWYFYP